MEDILEVYKQPYNAQCPQVCIDEMSTQLIGEVRAPLPAEPGKPLRYDTEYTRNGTANIFLAFEPLALPFAHFGSSFSRIESLVLRNKELPMVFLSHCGQLPV